MNKKLILTGASGSLGRALAERLSPGSHALLLTDVADYPAPIPDGAEFRRIDLADKDAVLALAGEAASILHFGAASTDRPFDEILAPNIVGTYNVFELARLAEARVIFASSNHVIGFHTRDTQLHENCDMRPDSIYGLSKAYGELMARLYWDKYGVQSLSIRIGTCLEAPLEERHLSTWLSYDDLARLVGAALSVDQLGCRIVWGASANTRRWWRDHGLASLGYRPEDDAEEFLPLPEPTTKGDWIESRYQGGSYCSAGYSRREPSPLDVFEWMKKD